MMKKFIETKKGKMFIILGIIVGLVIAFYAYNEYVKYQETMKSHVEFIEEKTIGLANDPMLLIANHDADEIKLIRIIGGDIAMQPSEYEELYPGIYRFVFEAKKGNKVEEFTVEVEVKDNVSPVITGALDKEIEYAAEIDLLNGVTAEDKVDGMVEVTSTTLDNKKIGVQPIEYTAKDAAGNETKLMINVTVKQPTCAANASWNGENCVCDAGYTGDGWTACTFKKTASASNGNNHSSGGNQTSGNSGSSSTGASNNQGTSSSSGSNGWAIESPTQEMEQNLWNYGNSTYGENSSWVGWVTSDGNMIIGQ